MRPKRNTYTLGAANLDGYVESVNTNGVAVGAAFTLAASGPDDGCSHQVAIVSTANISGVVFTLTGTDAEGRTISENVTGGNTVTVYATKYYATLTSVVKYSGAGGANAFTVGWTALARTPIYPINIHGSIPALIAVDMGGTCTYSAQETHGDVFSIASDTLQFTAISGMSGVAADSAGVAKAGTTGFRIAVASHTSGTLAVTYSQGRG